MTYYLPMFSVDVAVASSCKLGEGPAWDDRIRSLYFVDILGKKIFTYSPESNTSDSFSTELTPGAVIPCTNRKLLLALEDGIYSCNEDGTELERLHDIESEILGNRMNDAKCDRAGVLFGGTMGDGSTPSGNLYRITERESRRLRTGVTVSNGLAWSTDSTKMYYIDSALQSVLVADFDPETSSAREFKEFTTFPKEFGIPDGMCADLEDGIWVAYFGGRAVRRFDHLGKQTHVIELPVSQVTSCAFSGEGSSILYITTASVDFGSGNELEKEAGHVFRVETGIAGQGTYAFKLN